jgi:hypothetical protein
MNRTRVPHSGGDWIAAFALCKSRSNVAAAQFQPLHNDRARQRAHRGAIVLDAVAVSENDLLAAAPWWRIGGRRPVADRCPHRFAAGPSAKIAVQTEGAIATWP